MSIRILIERPCPECNGVGTVPSGVYYALPYEAIRREPIEKPCPTCKGRGTVPGAITVQELKKLIEEV